MEKKVEIRVNAIETTEKWARSVIFLIVALFGPIGLGIVADSAAMQWAGFAMGMLCIIGYAKKVSDEQTFKTFRAAIAYLEKLEKEHQQ